MTDPKDEEERLQASKEALEWSKEALAHERRRKPRVLSLSSALKKYQTENHFSDYIGNLFRS